MSLHSDLLFQAKQLVVKEPTRPKQASLRRAVSAAYYAIFHLLIFESSKSLVTGDGLRKLVGRAFAHGDMKNASKPFASGSLPARLQVVIAPPVPAQIQVVAKAFIALQQARHEADYNTAKSFSKSEAQALVDQADQAFDDWKAVRKTDYAKLYLVSLFVGKRWER